MNCFRFQVLLKSNYSEVGFFGRWRHWARKSSKHRQTVANFPSTPANFDLATQTKMLAISRYCHLGNVTFSSFYRDQKIFFQENVTRLTLLNTVRLQGKFFLRWWLSLSNSSSELERRRESFPTIKERLAQTKQLDLALAATELQEEFAEKMVMTKLDWPVVASKSGRSLKILLVVPTRQETEGLCAVLKHKFSGQKVSEISRLPDDDGVITCQPVSESTALCVRVLQDQQIEELIYRYGRWKHFSVYIQLWKDLFWNNTSDSSAFGPEDLLWRNWSPSQWGALSFKSFPFSGWHRDIKLAGNQKENCLSQRVIRSFTAR